MCPASSALDPIAAASEAKCVPGQVELTDQGIIRRRIALIAHDRQKPELVEWVRDNMAILSPHELSATGTTGRLLAEIGLDVHQFLSGPLGGDQQIGAAVAEGRIDLIVFFWDPLEMQPHDADVKALLRIAVVCNIPVACNRATAEMLLGSSLLGGRQALPC